MWTAGARGFQIEQHFYQNVDFCRAHDPGRSSSCAHATRVTRTLDERDYEEEVIVTPLCPCLAGARVWRGLRLTMGGVSSIWGDHCSPGTASQHHLTSWTCVTVTDENIRDSADSNQSAAVSPAIVDCVHPSMDISSTCTQLSWVYTCLTSAPRVPSYLECCSVTSLCVHVSRHKPPVTLSTHHGLSQASQCSMVTSFHFMSLSALTAICLHLAAAPARKQPAYKIIYCSALQLRWLQRGKNGNVSFILLACFVSRVPSPTCRRVSWMPRVQLTRAFCGDKSSRH